MTGLWQKVSRVAARWTASNRIGVVPAPAIEVTALDAG